VRHDRTVVREFSHYSKWFDGTGSSRESPAQAKAVVDRWAAVVAACPQLATWHAREPSDLGRAWELDTGDDHELWVELLAAGADKARPTLTIRLNEI